MTVRAPFQPNGGGHTLKTTAAVSASISLEPQAKSVRIYNTNATRSAYVRIGNGAQTASSSDLLILPRTILIVTKSDGDDTLACIWDGGAAQLSVTTGEGG